MVQCLTLYNTFQKRMISKSSEMGLREQWLSLHGIEDLDQEFGESMYLRLQAIVITLLSRSSYKKMFGEQVV